MKSRCQPPDGAELASTGHCRFLVAVTLLGRALQIHGSKFTALRTTLERSGQGLPLLFPTSESHFGGSACLGAAGLFMVAVGWDS